MSDAHVLWVILPDWELVPEPTIIGVSKDGGLRLIYRCGAALDLLPHQLIEPVHLGAAGDQARYQRNLLDNLLEAIQRYEGEAGREAERGGDAGT